MLHYSISDPDLPRIYPPSGNRSMAYFLSLMYIMGTPGILRIFLLRSLSQVATM